MHNILFSLWFFLPAGIANVSPVFVSHVGFLKPLYVPLDLGRKFNGKRVLGDNKTWLGLTFGVFIGFVVIALQVWGFNHSEWIRTISGTVNYDQTSILLLGPLLGFGAMFGDAIESFFKRQANIKAGHTWFPFDQIDYVIGGLIFSLPIIVLNWSAYIWIIIVWTLIHIISVYIGYLVGLRSEPI